MRLIKEYLNFDTLSLPKGIVLTNDERMDINRIINNALVMYYKINRYHKDPININGKVLVPEYLFKIVNNRTLLNKIVNDPNREIVSNVNSKEDLINFIKSNQFDLFNVDGKYFKYVYSLVKSTSNKGRKFESDAFKKFEDIAKLKGKPVSIEAPTLEEDLYGGIDGTFKIDNKRYTIQVKPLSRIEEYASDSSKYIVYCDGMLQQLKTDYLIAINNSECYIFRCNSGVVKDKFFIIPKANLVV